MRLTALTLAAFGFSSILATAAENVAGKWTFDGDIQGNQVTLTCTLQQAADASVSGRCDVNGMGESDITGTLKESDFQFSLTVSGYTLNYTGKVTGDSAAGDIEVAGAAGKFTGTRAKA